MFGTMQYRPEDDVAEAKKELHRQVLIEWQLRWQETEKGAVHTSPQCNLSFAKMYAYSVGRVVFNISSEFKIC